MIDFMPLCYAGELRTGLVFGAITGLAINFSEKVQAANGMAFIIVDN
jgi:hypothetical protein